MRGLSVSRKSAPATTLRVYAPADCPGGVEPEPLCAAGELVYRPRWRIGADAFRLEVYSAVDIITGGVPAGSVPIAPGLWGSLRPA